MKTLIIALAASTALSTAAFAEPLTVNMCTGGEDRPYHQTGKYIAEFLKDAKHVKVNVLTTDGTLDNMSRAVSVDATPETLAAGEACQVFIGQPDGPAYLKRKTPADAALIKKIGDGPVEYLHVLCNKDSGIKDLSQLAGDSSKSVALGKDNSGAWLIWQNFVNEDSSYADVVVSNESGAIAMSSVATGDTTCVIVPAAVVNATVAEADVNFGDQLVLVGANDKDFNDATTIDGKPLYSWHEIPSGSYPANLQSSWFSEVSTIAWTAGIYINKDYFEDNSKALEELIVAIAKARPAIQQTFGTLE